MRCRNRVGLLFLSPPFNGLERRTSDCQCRCVLFFELTMGIFGGHQSSIEILARCLERFDGVSMCKVAFSDLRSKCLPPSHLLRERGVERCLLPRNLFRGRLSIGGGLLVGELSCRFLIGQLPSKRRLLSARSPFETSQRDHGVGQLALKRARDARRFRHPCVGLFLNLSYPCLGVGLCRRVQLVGEPEDTSGLDELLLEALCLNGRIRKLLCQCRFASTLVLDRTDDMCRMFVPYLLELRQGIGQFLFELLPQCRRIGQFPVAPTEVLGKGCGFTHTTTVGASLGGFGLLTCRVHFRKSSFHRDANGVLLLDGRLELLLANTQLVERLLGPFIGARGRGLAVAQLPLKRLVTGREGNLLSLWPLEVESSTNGLRQLVEERRVSRHYLISNGSHRHQHLARADQGNSNDRNLDTDTARVGDECFEVPGVGFDLDDQGGDVAILVNPASRLAQARSPGDSDIRPDGAEGQTGLLRCLAFACDIQKLHAQQPPLNTCAFGWLSV